MQAGFLSLRWEEGLLWEESYAQCKHIKKRMEEALAQAKQVKPLDKSAPEEEEKRPRRL